MNRGSKTWLAFTMLTMMAPSIASSDASDFTQERAQETTPGITVQESNSSQNAVQILTATQGVDFGQYIYKLRAIVKKNWYASMPDAALAGEKGKTIVRFQIQSDGRAENISTELSSGKDFLDQAATKGIRDSSPFDPLPSAFKGPHIALRVSFFYNLPIDAVPSVPPRGSNAPTTETPQAPPFDRLELLAFAMGNFDPGYISHEIGERGLSFSPDAAFLNAVRSTEAASEVIGAVSGLKPNEALVPSSQRTAAFDVLVQAVDDVHKRQYASAGENYNRALQLAPESASLHLAYCADLLMLKRYEQAEVECRRSMQIWPGDAEAHTLLANTLMGQSRNSQAIPEAREALRIFPSGKAALIALGMSLTRSRQYADAIPILHEAIRSQPIMTLLHKHLGVCLLHTGDIDGAIEELTVYLSATPADAEAHYSLGAALRQKGKPDEALAQFREAARIEPNNPLYATVANPDEAHSSPDKSAGPHPDDGFFSGNVYTNTFFGFSYEYPKHWTVLRADAGTAIMRLGGAFLANGDPTQQDLAETAARNAHPLLAVVEGTGKEWTSGRRVIQIQAMDQHTTPNVKSGEDIARSVAAMYQSSGAPLQIVGPPEKLPIGDWTFWKVNTNVRVNNSIQHGAELIAVEKGYVLMFVFMAPNPSGLDEIVKTMQSLRFSDASH